MYKEEGDSKVYFHQCNPAFLIVLIFYAVFHYSSQGSVLWTPSLQKGIRDSSIRI